MASGPFFWAFVPQQLARRFTASGFFRSRYACALELELVSSTPKPAARSCRRVFLCNTTSSPRHKAHFGAKFDPEI
jgi:hypothetical protein